MMKRRYALITLICLTQIVNSNMAVIAAIIGIGCSRLNINIKIATVLVLGVLVYSLGAVFFLDFMMSSFLEMAQELWISYYSNMCLL